MRASRFFLTQKKTSDYNQTRTLIFSVMYRPSLPLATHCYIIEYNGATTMTHTKKATIYLKTTFFLLLLLFMTALSNINEV